MFNFQKSIAVLATVLCALVLSGCGGGGDPEVAADPATTPPPETSAVGTPIGDPVNATIGAAGGQVTSADGSLVVEVPAGALDKNETIGIQEISNEAKGAPGRSWRITPEGLHAAVPMTLRFRYTPEELQGTSLDAIRIGYQDSLHRWHLYKSADKDGVNHVVSVQTTHFSDWARLATAWLVPDDASVIVGHRTTLKIKQCSIDGADSESAGLELLKSCPDAERANMLNPSVNGEVYGNGTVGTIAYVDPSVGTSFVYQAPDIVPSPSTVAVSVELLQPSIGNARQYLTASIRVLPDVRTCEWLRSAATLAFDASFDPYEYSANQGAESYSGRTSGSIQGVLVNQLPATNPTRYGSWISDMASLQGTVALNDHHTDGDGKTSIARTGSGPAVTGQGGSGFVLIVDYDACSYTINASYAVQTTETTTYDGNVSTRSLAVTAATMAGNALPISLPGKISADRQAQAVLRLDDTPSGSAGFSPIGQTDSLRATPSARVRWNIVAP